jgi:hypothetical protein
MGRRRRRRDAGARIERLIEENIFGARPDPRVREELMQRGLFFAVIALGAVIATGCGAASSIETATTARGQCPNWITITFGDVSCNFDSCSLTFGACVEPNGPYAGDPAPNVPTEQMGWAPDMHETMDPFDSMHVNGDVPTCSMSMCHGSSSSHNATTRAAHVNFMTGAGEATQTQAVNWWTGTVDASASFQCVKCHAAPLSEM